jgi:hypothetical protein
VPIDLNEVDRVGARERIAVLGERVGGEAKVVQGAVEEVVLQEAPGFGVRTLVSSSSEL